MPGTIVILTNEGRLYYFVGSGEAIRYPVGVGRAGMQWSGVVGARINPGRLPVAAERHSGWHLG